MHFEAKKNATIAMDIGTQHDEATKNENMATHIGAAIFFLI